VADDDLSVLTERPGWTVVEDLAIFRPDPDGWYARVARMQRPGRAVDRYHIRWTILPAGNAQLIRDLDRSPQWRRVYADKVGVIHVRREAPSAT